jgi:hypothetical protein
MKISKYNAKFFTIIQKIVNVILLTVILCSCAFLGIGTNTSASIKQNSIYQLDDNYQYHIKNI